MGKCVRYLRVSSEGQIDKYGLDAQDDMTAKYAERNGLEVVETFRELAVSGKDGLEHRDALGELLAYLDANDDVRVILIPDLSRLARDLILQETLLGDFQARGYTIESVMEPDLCSDDPTRKLMRQMIGAFNEYERVKITLKLRGGRIQKAKKGGHAQGRHALGYTTALVDGKRVVRKVDDELAVVREIRKLRDGRRWSWRRIADELNANDAFKPKNWTPESPTKFYASTVSKIYANPKYDGVVTLKDGDSVISAQNDEFKI